MVRLHHSGARRGASRADGVSRLALRAFVADVGEGLPVVPWRTPAEAMRWLDAGDRALVGRLRGRLEQSFLSPAPHVELTAALAEVDPDQAVAVYPSAPPGGLSWVGQTFTDRARASDEPIVNQDVLPEVRLYELDGEDPFEDRPVACAPLFAGATTGNDPLGFVERVLMANGLRDQLRMVIYDRGRASLFAGWYRGARARRFDERDHALMLAARPAMRTWARTAAAIGVRPLGDGALIGALDALPRPALLLRGGRVLYGNASGRAMATAVTEWASAGRPAGFASVTSLGAAGMTLELVLPTAPPQRRQVATLPPSLERVAAELARGATDKEIGARLGLPLATARTYVSRVLAKLGARDRRAVIRAFAADGVVRGGHGH